MVPSEDERERLAREHHPAVRRFLLQLCAGHEDAEDLAQTACLRALARLDRFEPARGSHRAWFLGFALREHRRWRIRKPWLPLLDTLAAPRPDLDVRHDLRAALRRLSPPLRAAFLIRHVEGLSSREAAEALGIPEGTLKRRLSEARASLRRHLADPAAPLTETPCTPNP